MSHNNLAIALLLKSGEGGLNESHVKALEYLDKLIGLNHVFGKFYAATGGRLNICTECHNQYGTFDFDNMTRAVVLSHAMGIRFTIMPATGKMLRIFVEPSDKHPGLDHLVQLCTDNILYDKEGH